MTLRIGWLSPLTPASGVGTFTYALAQNFPERMLGEDVDLTLLYEPHERIYHAGRRAIQLQDWPGFENVLGLFDVVVYNVGNNAEHHRSIFSLLRRVPGIVIFHDYVYQHYLAHECLEVRKSAPSYASFLAKYGGSSALDVLSASRISSRFRRPIYGPWDTDHGQQMPLSAPFAQLASAVVVHSEYAEREVRRGFDGPVLRLWMPSDQKPSISDAELDLWKQHVGRSGRLNLLSFGHIGRSKCLDIVIGAIAASQTLKNEVTFTIAGFAGAIDYVDRLKSAVLAQGLGGVVNFEIGVSDKRLNELVRTADLFVNLRHPNTEGSSVSLVEQMACGKPVVIYDTGCYAEVPEGAAFKVRQIRDVAALRECLEMAVKNRDSLSQVGALGRKYVSDRSCREYADSLLRFVIENRSTIGARGAFGANQYSRTPPSFRSLEGVSASWLRGLSASRFSFDLLDKHIAPIDPTLILSLDPAGLASYIRLAILGAPPSEQAEDVVATCLSAMETSERYWSIVLLHLIISAVYDGESSSVERILALAPIFDIALWKILAELPEKGFLKAAQLMLSGRMMADDELDGLIFGAPADYPVFLKIVSMVQKARPGGDLQVQKYDQLKEWLWNSAVLPIHFPQEEAGAGSLHLGKTEKAAIIGFHELEPGGGVWTGGCLAYVSFVPADEISGVEIEFEVLGTSSTGARQVRISQLNSDSGSYVSIARDQTTVVTLPIVQERIGHSTPPQKGVTIEVFADRAVRPSDFSNSDDRRLIGVFVRKITLVA